MSSDLASGDTHPERDARPEGTGSRTASIAVGVLVLAGLAIAVLAGRGETRQSGADLPVRALAGKPGRYETAFEVMGTDGRFDVRAGSMAQARRMFQQALDRVRAIERLMSTYRPDSEISRLNALGSEEAVEVSADTVAVMRAALDMSRLTDGAFDATYAPLRTLWRAAVSEGREPDAGRLAETLLAVGWEKVAVQGSTVRFKAPGMELDLGGIAKGYAIDRAAETLRAAGAEAGLVDLGGDLRLFGPGSADGKWRVLVRRPPGVEEERILVLGPCAVATSGDYARYFRIGDRKFSHIVDPRTGHPVSDVPSATVVAPDATTADGLATAISVLGAEEGLRLAESLSGVECLIMTRRADGGIDVRMSAGFAGLLEGG